MSRYIYWGIIFGMAIGSVTGVVVHSTSFGIGLGAAIAVIVALIWSTLDKNRPRDPEQ